MAILVSIKQSGNPQRFATSMLSMLIALLWMGTNQTRATDIADVDPLTRQAVELSKQGKLQEARDLEAKAISQNPKDWVCHEALSYFSWLQGDIVKATTEAQQAAMLAPNQEIVFTNLGQIQEHVYQYQDAIPAYDYARRITPTKWEPWIGLAQSFVLNNNSKDGLTVLHYMESQKNRNFEWYYQIGQTYLNLERPDLAVAPLFKARSLATTEDQKSDSASQGLLALLRDNDSHRAMSMATDVLGTYHPKNHELYIRAAALTLPISAPDSGKRFLKLCMKNLSAAQDGDAFFKIGRIFGEKADAADYDASARHQWLVNAEVAHRQAIALDPGIGSYHLALAGILDKQAKDEEVLKELEKAKSLELTDKLAPILVSSIMAAHNNQVAQSQAPSVRQKAAPFNLSEVRFGVKGVSCACKIKLIKTALEKVEGVTLVTVSYDKPFQGTLLVDQSVTPVDKVFLQALKSVFPFDYTDSAPVPGVTMEVYASRPVTSAADAVAVAQRIGAGEPLQFDKPQIRNGMGAVRFELAEVGAAKKTSASLKTSL